MEVGDAGSRRAGWIPGIWFGLLWRAGAGGLLAGNVLFVFGSLLGAVPALPAADLVGLKLLTTVFVFANLPIVLLAPLNLT